MSDGSDGRIEWRGRETLTVDGVVQRIDNALAVHRSPRDVLVIDRGCMRALSADWRKRGDRIAELEEWKDDVEQYAMGRPT